MTLALASLQAARPPLRALAYGISSTIAGHDFSRRTRAQQLVAAATSEQSKSSYLIWDAGFGVRFVGTAIALAAMAFGASRSTTAWLFGMELQGRLMTQLQMLAHRYEWWSLLGLLSSSCCALQLLLNVFSFGCAGFNTLLGPLRPYLLAITAALQASVWHAALRGRGASLVSSAVGGTLLCLALAFLPEVIELRVKYGRSVLAAVDEASSDDVCVVRVGGMGCTACTLKVQAALEALPGVRACAVNLESGRATLSLVPPSRPKRAAEGEAGGEPDAEQRAEVERAIVEAGFEVVV